MSKKTLILKRERRIRVLVLLHVVLVALALSPLLIGVGLMSLQEFFTGHAQHEGNSALGVLPWLTIVTLAIFGPAVTFLFNLSLLAIVYDIIVLSWPKRSE